MTTTNTKACKTCGADFKRSPADATVNCPPCRGGAAKPKATAYPAITCCKCGTTFTALRCTGCGY